MNDDRTRELSAHAVTFGQLVVSSHSLGYRTMRMFFLGGLLLTALLVVLSVASDAGPDPLGRFAVLGTVLAGWGYACCAPVKAADALRSPRLVFLLAVVLIAVAVFDGGLRHSVLESEEYILLGVAAVSGNMRRLLGVSLLLSLGMLATLPLGYPSRRLATEPVLEDLVTQWGLTSVLVASLQLWTTSWKHAAERLNDVRGGAPALTPALSAAITGLPLLSPGQPRVIDRLSLTELEVVRRLAGGLAPKQVAACSDPPRSIHTIRVHIKNAKRKTGANTVAQLVALYSDRDSPRS